MKAAVVQLGRHGDLLILLPALKWLADQGKNLLLITHRQYAHIAQGLPWLEVLPTDYDIPDIAPALKLARSVAEEIRVTQLAFIAFTPTQRSYQLELWHRAGVPVELFNELPLELARDPQAEIRLIDQWLPQR